MCPEWFSIPEPPSKQLLMSLVWFNPFEPPGSLKYMEQAWAEAKLTLDHCGSAKLNLLKYASRKSKRLNPPELIPPGSTLL